MIDALAWVAGVIDAEGTFRLRSQRSPLNDIQYAVPEISVCNTNLHILKKLQNVFIEQGIESNTGIQERNPQRNLQRYSMVGMKRCKYFLDKILPYLITKQPQANVMYDWLKESLGRPRIGRGKGSGTYRQHDFEVKEKISKLNKQEITIPLQINNIEASSMFWLSGFIDGDGTLYISKTPARKHRSARFTPVISITNTDTNTLLYLEKVFGKHNIPFYVRWQPQKFRKDGKLRKAVWRIDIRGVKRTTRMLEVIQPYLYSKAAQAVVMLDWNRNVIKRPQLGENGKYNVFDEEAQRAISELNQYPQRLYVKP